MAGQSKPKITDRDITGLKYFEKLRPLFERLREVGCERDTAGNRDLHCDESCCLVLLFFFNPIVDSRRVLLDEDLKFGWDRSKVFARRRAAAQPKVPSQRSHGRQESRVGRRDVAGSRELR